MSRRLPRWRGLEQDKAVAQKTALCRISSLPAGALAFQRSEDRSDTAERCSRLVCHNQGRLLVLHYYQTHLSRFRTTHPFLTALLSALKLLHFIFGQTVLTQKAGNSLVASITIKQLAGTDTGDHHRRVEIPCQGQVWDSEQANVTTLPLLVISILIYLISILHRYHSGQRKSIKN